MSKKRILILGLVVLLLPACYFGRADIPPTLHPPPRSCGTQSYPDFVDSMTYSVRNTDLGCLGDLMNDTVYVQFCTGTGCNNEVTQTTRESALGSVAAQLSKMTARSGALELQVEAHEKDVSAFPRAPVYADHTFVAFPPDRSAQLYLGFDYLGSAYLITDILLLN